jgi:alpha-D-ribose 1-methylphosphonate 5-triphosphate synthase subunit PhnH
MHTARDPGCGFADPVFDAQAAFRALLGALSRPGEILRLAPAGFRGPEGLAPATAICLLTLADRDTPVWLAGGENHPAALWLAFHAGAVVTADPAKAAFVAFDGASQAPRLCDFPAGEERYPDRSATLIVQCADLSGGLPVQLTGPGIEKTAVLAPHGLRAGFWDEVRANAARFPLGVDLFLAAGESIAGIPRTAHVSVREEARRCM